MGLSEERCGTVINYDNIMQICTHCSAIIFDSLKMIQQVSFLQTQSTHLEEIHALQQRVGELERDLSDCQTNLHKLGEQLQLRDLHLQQKSHKITELSRQVITAL